MDAYLEEELDILIYCIQNPDGSEFETKKKRAEEIGSELYADGGLDAMENMLSNPTLGRLLYVPSTDDCV